MSFGPFTGFPGPGPRTIQSNKGRYGCKALKLEKVSLWIVVTWMSFPCSLIKLTTLYVKESYESMKSTLNVIASVVVSEYCLNVVVILKVFQDKFTKTKKKKKGPPRKFF